MSCCHLSHPFFYSFIPSLVSIPTTVAATPHPRRLLPSSIPSQARNLSSSRTQRYDESDDMMDEKEGQPTMEGRR